MIPLGKYQRTGKLIWTTESSAAFKLSQQAISNCQELYFLEDTATPILHTDASDYGIGGCLYMVTNGILQQNPHRRSIELVCQGERVLRDPLWLQDFRGLTRQSSLHPED